MREYTGKHRTNVTTERIRQAVFSTSVGKVEFQLRKMRVVSKRFAYIKSEDKGELTQQYGWRKKPTRQEIYLNCPEALDEVMQFDKKAYSQETGGLLVVAISRHL